MKIILRIIIIITIGSIIAGAFSLGVNKSSNAAGLDNGGQAPATIGSNGQSQPMARPDGGDRAGGSVTQGVAGVLGTLVKITGITILVLAIQKGFGQPGNRKLISTQE